MGVVQRHTDLPEYLEHLQLRYFAAFVLLYMAEQVFLVEFLLDPDVIVSFEPAETASDVLML